MKLLVDIGNSRIKWALHSERELSGHDAASLDGEDLEALLVERFSALPKPVEVWVSNVAGPAMTRLLTRLAKELWDLKPAFPRVERGRFGLTTDYRDPARLGIDRWLALLAAWERSHKPLCVVACGTAVTLDLVDPEGRHLGGFIVPGLAMMMQALREHTSAVREGGESDPVPVPGLSTGECVTNGCAMAIAAFIDHNANLAMDKFGRELVCMMTGGGAHLLRPLMKQQFQFDAALVLRGLALVAGVGPS